MNERLWSTLAMRAKLAKTLLALVLALSLTLNGGSMTSANAKPVSSPPVVTPVNDVTPCRHAKNGQRHYPCCPKHSPEKYFCTADCCTSVVPVVLFPFSRYLGGGRGGTYPNPCLPPAPGMNAQQTMAVLTAMASLETLSNEDLIPIVGLHGWSPVKRLRMGRLARPAFNSGPPHGPRPLSAINRLDDWRWPS